MMILHCRVFYHLVASASVTGMFLACGACSTPTPLAQTPAIETPSVVQARPAVDDSPVVTDMAVPAVFSLRPTSIYGAFGHARVLPPPLAGEIPDTSL